ncbi:MAG: hypothetical protein M1828_007072 [Chrysothrix sp. TS-e1954]|nr:MAG: hypothetical protein M1828_007072 [Chrysothrix sp. TS-e1954]
MESTGSCQQHQDGMPALVSADSTSSGTSTGIARRRQNSDLRARVPKKNDNIFSAAFAGDTLAVRRFLEQGIPIDSGCWQYGTPLAAAAQGGQPSTTKYLLEADAAVNINEGRFGSPLHSAVFGNNMECVSQLLDAGADLDVDGPQGTPMQVASTYNCIAVAEKLIESGANIHRRDFVAYLPLQIACRHGFTQLALNLIEKGASVDVVDEYQDTPLHHSVDLDRLELTHAILKQLSHIENRRDHYDNSRPGVRSRSQIIDSQNTDGRSPLHVAASQGFHRLVKALLSNGADHSVEDKFSAQPLFRAVDMGHEECVRLLLRAGASTDHADNQGRRALHCVPKVNPLRIQLMLLEAGSRGSLMLLEAGSRGSVNAQDSHGRTALHEATEKGLLANVQQLLSWPRVKSHLQDYDQQTALHIAVKNGLDSIALCLLNACDAPVNARSGNTIQQAIVQGNKTIAAAMLDWGPNDAQGGCYGSLAGAAAYVGDDVLLDKLLSLQVNINISGGEFGTPLQAAVWRGSESTVQLLLENGADPNASGGKFGCSLRAANLALKQSISPCNGALETTMTDFKRNRSQEIIDHLLEYVAEEKPFNMCLKKRWKLTPGGWGWVPKATHSNEDQKCSCCCCDSFG